MVHRHSRTIVLATAILAVAALPAAAKTTSNLSTTGASLTGINYAFDPWPCTSACVGGHWSAMDYSATVKDTNAGDGNDVFVHAKVDAYGYAAREYTSSAARSRSISQSIVGGADPAQSGQIQVCRDRGTLLPDNCAATPVLYR